MLRSLLAIVAGYFTITALNSFIHVIVSVYFRTGLFLTGIANLPSGGWVYGFTALQFIFGLFGGLLTATLAQERQHLAIPGFILLMVIIGFMDYSILAEREPLWYLITSPALKISGIFIGYQLYLKQNSAIKEYE